MALIDPTYGFVDNSVSDTQFYLSQLPAGIFIIRRALVSMLLAFSYLKNVGKCCFTYDLVSHADYALISA